MTSQVIRIRRHLLLSSATAALMVVFGPAHAQTVDFSLDSGAVGTASAVDRGTVSVTTQELTGAVLSSIVDGGLAQSSSGAVGSSAVDISANALLANARGNSADTQGQLLGDAADGRIGLLTGQVASNTVTANINDSTISAVLSTTNNATGSSFAALGNQIDARATVNTAGTVFSDDIEANLGGLLASDTTAVATATLTRGDFNTQLVDVDGASSVVASSQVMTDNATASAVTANDNAILLDLTDGTTSSDAINSALAIDGNQIRAALTGNTAVTGTDLSVDTGFGGTGVVLNQQQIGDGTDTIALTAIADSNALSVDLTEETESSVSVRQNVIGTSTIGNTTRDGAGAGTFLFVDANQITTNSEEANVSFANTDVLSLDGAFVAGTQQQILDSAGGMMTLTSTNTASTMGVTTANVVGSVVDIARNTLFATAKGNDAATAIGLSGTSVDASAALGNQQSVVGSVMATLGNSTDPSVFSATVEGTLTDASVGIANNVLLGQSEANVARNQLTVTSDTAIAQTSPNNRAALFDTDADARGGFVLGSNQSFTGTNNTLRSVMDTDLLATIGTATAVGDISSSSVSINANQQSSVGMVNQVQNELDLSASLLGTGTSAVSSIISSVQDVEVGDVSASSTLDAALNQENYTIGTGALSVADSSLSVDGNQNRATVSGNEATNRLANTSETGIVGNLENESRANLAGAFSIRANSVLANEQSVIATTLNSDADTNVTLDGNVGADESGIVGSSLSLSENLTLAASSGNTGSSVIEQTAGTQSGATVALRNVQTTVVGNTTADAVVQFLMDTRGTATDTSFEINDNQIFASGAGNTAQNSVVAELTSFTGPADSIAYNAQFGLASAELGQARADFAILSDQDQTGSIAATANVDAQLRIRPTAANGGFLTDSSASINNTLARADALANQAVNSAEFVATSAATGVTGAIASRQTSDGAISATASTVGTTGQLIASVRRGLVDSSLSIDENVFNARAGANTASNRLTLEGGSLSGATEAADFVNLGARLDASADLASARSDANLANLQESAASTITAVADLEALMTTIDFDLERSSASINDNFARASGQGNEGVSIVDIRADTQATLTGAVANVQNNLSAIDVDAIFNGVISVASNRADGNSGLDESVAQLDNNITVATANGNTATSALQLEASEINGLSVASQSASIAQPLPGFTISKAQADNVVASQQVSDGVIDVAADSRSAVSVRGDIDKSSVSLTGNISQSAAIANRAINGVDLVASTAASSTSAVFNEQSGTANIAAASEVDVVMRQNIEGAAAPAIASSSIAMDDNLSIASAQGNDATNTLAVAGASVTGRDNTTDLTIDDGAITGFVTNTSDNVLASDQRRTGGSTISSSASVLAIALRDSDENVNDTSVNTPSSLTGSNATISSNIMDSTASANRVRNTVALNADTKLEASAGLVNTQSSDNPVMSEVQLTTQIGTDALGDVTSSSVALNGNIGVARANGNDAVNRVSALSSTEVSGASTAGGAATVTTGTSTVLNASADFAMLNNQTNNGAVTARASSAALPTRVQFATGGSVLNSSLSLSGNVLVADASSNRADNRMTVSGRAPSENVTVVTANRQIATGAVTSRVDTFRVSSVSADITSSTVRIGGNQFNASASGNIGSMGLIRD